jgi:lipoic acid synthetase
MRKQRRKPDWLKVKSDFGENYRKIKSTLADLKLHTVCQEAGCPNICECFEQRTATFLILGDVCTRGCAFCDVKKKQVSLKSRVSSLKTHLLPPDPSEAKRVAEMVKELNLEYAVITSVTRDDLNDGGANHFARTINEVKKQNSKCKVEVLIPDFGGSCDSLKIVLDTKPDVLNHNLETVKRLYPLVRKGADYERSSKLLLNAKRMDKRVITKSGLIIGLGEKWEEILETMRNLREIDCDLLTIGQYLRPTSSSYEVRKYYHPDEFSELKYFGMKLGFANVESGPLVRSSYKAKFQMQK